MSAIGRTEVAVVGGGIAGLAAAFELAKRRIPFRLLEAGPRWGGVIRTEAVDGFLLEGGPDTLLAQKPEALELCRELGLADRLVPTNLRQNALFVLHGRRLHRMPEGMVLGVPTRLLPLARSGLFSWRGKLRMAWDLVVPPSSDGADESIASFFRRRLGEESVARLAGPFLAGIHAGDPDRLSLHATFPRLAELEARHGSLVRGLLSARAASPGGPAPPAFYALRSGLAELVQALVEHLPPDGLSTHSAIRALPREGAGFRLELESGAAVRALAVILAVPAPRAAGLVAPHDPEAGRLLAGIPFASSATVFLGYRRQDVAHRLDGYGLIVAEGERLHTRACSFVSTKFPGRAPEGHVLLRGFVGGARRADSLRAGDAGLADLVHQEMAGVLGLQAPPVLTRVYRWPAATPQMEVGHLERMAALDARMAGLPGLFLTGAGLRASGIPDTVGDARRAARAAAARVPTAGAAVPATTA